MTQIRSRSNAIALLATAIALATALCGCTPAAMSASSQSASSGAGDARPVLSSTPTPVSVGSPTTAPAPFVPVDASAYATTLTKAGVDFDSPSGNLMCGILDWSAAGDTGAGLQWGCRVTSHTWTAPSSSPSDYCYSITEIECGSGVDAKDHEIPHPLANSGQAFAGEWPKGVVKALPYGHSITYKTITCESSVDGMTCRDSGSGHGFTVSKVLFQVF